jgi:UDP-N-acetylmuramate: L-alanyl-gamma-D-glutamyl-meso-diaminopimelate ligase
MVHLTDENDFIVLGDEYLSSPIDRRPKFHLYQPNIALISELHGIILMSFYVSELCGTVWNFCDQISRGGILVYNEEDLEVKRVEAATKPT